MSHWANQYVGLPWENGAEGPDAYNCWGLVREVQRRRFGLDLPAVDVDAADLRAIMREFRDNAEHENWVELGHSDQRQEGDVVLLAHARRPSHVGLWVDADGGGVLHSVEGAGVVFSTLVSLRHNGWGNLKFYRHRGRA